MNLRARLSTLIALRLLVSTALLGAAVLMELRGAWQDPVNPFYFLIGVTYGLSLLYGMTLRFAERHPWWIDVQLAIDAVLATAFIAVTGGITSAYSALSFLPIIAASFIRYRRAGMQVALVTACGYAVLVWAGFSEETFGVAAFTFVLDVVGFLAVAWLAGSLAESWRSAGASLERASHAIADLREFNDLVIDSLLSGIATADEHGRVMTFNRAATGITGLSQDAVAGRPLVEVFQLSQEPWTELVALAPRQSLRADVSYQRADGAKVEVGLTATTLAFPDGRVGYLVTFQDVTEIRRLERRARLQQRLAAVGEMAAGIAHEIRNPLASMSGSIQVLRQELALSDEQAQLMDIVVRESDRLNETIRSFLTYAKPQRFAVTRLDIAAIVRDVALLLRNGHDARDTHAVEARTPSSPVWYEADDTQIRQVLWNLATNGLRAMPGGGRLVLAVTEDEDGGVVLSVEDNGRGMDAAQIDSLFQPFVSSFEKGTGLGLAIVHRIVQDYGGVIQVASRPGQGSVFRVRLPQRDVRPAPMVEPIGVAV